MDGSPFPLLKSASIRSPLKSLTIFTYCFLSRCVGGFLQLIRGSPEMTYQSDRLAVCGQNERYSPPIVLFEDPPAASEAGGLSSASATLLFKIDETTSRSQFLAHYSFTPVDEPRTGIQTRGGTRVPDTGKQSSC